RSRFVATNERTTSNIPKSVASPRNQQNINKNKYLESIATTRVATF
ncbi:MAG: hypothetical protein ACI9XZ_002555, partial [Alphaproteobacteria bacterium]